MWRSVRRKLRPKDVSNVTYPQATTAIFLDDMISFLDSYISAEYSLDQSQWLSQPPITVRSSSWLLLGKALQGEKPWTTTLQESLRIMEETIGPASHLRTFFRGLITRFASYNGHESLFKDLAAVDPSRLIVKAMNEMALVKVLGYALERGSERHHLLGRMRGDIAFYNREFFTLDSVAQLQDINLEYVKKIKRYRNSPHLPLFCSHIGTLAQIAETSKTIGLMRAEFELHGPRGDWSRYESYKHAAVHQVTMEVETPTDQTEAVSQVRKCSIQCRSCQSANEIDFSIVQRPSKPPPYQELV